MIYIDSNLILERCPHCGVDQPNLTLQYQTSTQTFNGNNLRKWAFYLCHRCGGIVMVNGINNAKIVEVQEIFPSLISIHESIPHKAAIYLRQALNSLHSPSGAIMLAGSAIDSMLKNKGYMDGSLYSRINKAADDHIITSSMSKWAHQVRIESNEERHADEYASCPTDIEAKRSVDFALALAQFLFILPSLVEKGIEDSKIHTNQAH